MRLPDPRMMDIDGTRIACRVLGQGDPLLLLHGGWMTGVSAWGRCLGEFARRFRVILPDLRGHGQSENPGGRFDSYGQMAWDMIRLVEDLGETRRGLRVMGHSSGAVVALLMSAYQPALVERQVLIGIGATIGSGDRYRRGMCRVFVTADAGHPPSALRYTLGHPLNTLALRRMHQATGWYRLLCQSWPLWLKPVPLDKAGYGKIDAVTLALAGSRDEFVAEADVTAFTDLIPNVKIRILPRRDHMFPINDPACLLSETLPFLTASLRGLAE